MCLQLAQIKVFSEVDPECPKNLLPHKLKFSASTCENNCCCSKVIFNFFFFNSAKCETTEATNHQLLSPNPDLLWLLFLIRQTEYEIQRLSSIMGG